MNNIVYQPSPKKLKSVLITFLDQIIKPRFRDAFSRVEAEFTRTVVIQHQLDDAIQHNTQLDFAAAQQVKRYADYQMMRGDHKVAYSLYHQLVLHFPPEKAFADSQGLIGSLFSFASQSSQSKAPLAFQQGQAPDRADCLASASLCAACCDIIIGEVTSETVKLLHFLRDNSVTIQQRLLVSLLIFWVLPRIGQPSPDVLLDFLDSACESEAQAAQPPPRSMIKSSSFTTIPVLSSIRASFSLNNLAATIYRQISSDDLSSQVDDNSAFKLTFPIIVEPFLHEQIIQFYSHRQLPFQYFLLARRFDMIGQKENYVRCLWNSFITLMGSEGGPQYHNCELCLAFLIERIVNVLLRQKNFADQPKSDARWFLADYIGYLMRFDNIERLPVFASYFSMWDSRGTFYKAGFIRASVKAFETRNPQHAAPRRFRGSWRTLAAKLFGVRSASADAPFFFSPDIDDSVCDTVSPGDEIRVTVSITNKAAHFSVGDTWLRVRGGKSESQHVSVGSGRVCDASYAISVGDEGCIIHVEGVNAVWVNNVCLFTLFRRPLCFRCIAGDPSVVVEEVSCTHESFAGEATLLRLVLHVGRVPLSSLSLLIEPDDAFVPDSSCKRSLSPPSFIVLSPQSRCIGGQFFFGPAEAGDDVAVTVMHTSTSPGRHSHWLFFSFAAAGRPSRYACYNYRVDVIRPPEPVHCRASMFPCFFDLYDEQRIEASLRPVSESRTFQLTLTNAGKRDVCDVSVEFLERKEGVSGVDVDCTEHSVRHGLSCSFETDFFSYFGGDGNSCPDTCTSLPGTTHDYSSSFDKFIVYGFTKKRFTTVGARKSVAFCFGFESLDHESYPYLRITVRDKSYISDMSAIMHFYDMRALENVV